MGGALRHTGIRVFLAQGGGHLGPTFTPTAQYPPGPAEASKGGEREPRGGEGDKQ